MKTWNIRCTCMGRDAGHTIWCLLVAAAHPDAMINDDGEVFYPDSPQDAAWFAAEHDAYPLAGASQ